MTVTIPVWLMWTVGLVIGIPAAACVIFFAIIGFLFVKGYGKGLNW